MVTHRQLQEAKEYLEQAIKQYNLDEVYINSLSDEEYVALAKKMQSEDKEHEWNG
jgi:GTP-dependent phosphoenolpyruvate carboxykinase